MSPERRRELGKLGGTSAQSNGTGHKWDQTEAAKASEKGVEARRRNKTDGKMSK